MTPEQEQKKAELLAEIEREIERVNQVWEAHCKKYHRDRRRMIVMQNLNGLLFAALLVNAVIDEAWLLVIVNLAGMLLTARWKILPKNPMDLVKKRG